MTDRSPANFIRIVVGVIVVAFVFGLGRRKSFPVSDHVADLTESDMTDAVSEDTVRVPPSVSSKTAVSFQIRLGEAYYHQGIVNPGAQASMHLGAHGEPVTVHFDDETRPVLSKINRTANPGGYARLVGGNSRFRDWFQSHFAFGDVVEAEVLDRSNIVFHRKAASQ